MPFLETEKDTRFEFEGGLLKGTRWTLAGQVCPSVTCNCEVLELNLLPAGDTDDGKRVRRTFFLDFATRDIVKDETPQKDRLFAEAFVAQLGTTEWKRLWALFQSLKQEVYQKADLTKTKYNFPVGQIENAGLMIAYNEVLPFHKRPELEIDGRWCLAVDHHDVSLRGRDADTVVAFYMMNAESENDVERADETISISLDLTAKTWKYAETIAKSPIPMNQLVSACLAEFDYDFFAARRCLLRDMYLHNHGAEVSRSDRGYRAPSKVGRNDPCPCGSGKKYKKCCGR